MSPGGYDEEAGLGARTAAPGADLRAAGGLVCLREEQSEQTGVISHVGYWMNDGLVWDYFIHLF